MTLSRTKRRTLVALLIAGYAAAWSAFGLVAHVFDAALHLLVERTPTLLTAGWLIGAAIVALAGVFQFSTLETPLSRQSIGTAGIPVARASC